MAAAQAVELLGTRALGMGGAFVAVADDATAAYWNPAGLATGHTFSMLIDRSTLEAIPNREGPVDPATRATSGSGAIVALSTPALGIIYCRLQTTSLRPQPQPKVGAQADRQPTRSGAIGADSLVTHQVGVSLVQTVIDGLTVGTTVKLVRGIAASGSLPADGSTGDLLDQAEDLAGLASTTVDADFGVMAALGSSRIGLVVRNLREPEFPAPAGTEQVLRLERQARLGAAWTPGRPGSAPGAALTLALDVDLTRTPAAAGDRRNVAAGVERWFARRVGVRGGVRINTLETDDVSASAGASVALRANTYVEGHITHGRAGGDRAWGIAGRLSF